jgi:hypothetical protein
MVRMNIENLIYRINRGMIECKKINRIKVKMNW